MNYFKDMEKTVAFVIMYNRLTWPDKMCTRLVEMGCEVVLVDNGSTYPPLLEWYDECPYEKVFLPYGSSHKSVWEHGIVDKYTDRDYIVTDHDLDLSGVPLDMVDFLRKGLNDARALKIGAVKSGLSLRISDLPSNTYTEEVIKWERAFWHNPTTVDGFYLSNIDTTLALYAKERFDTVGHSSDAFYAAVRSPEPYVARHLPWYNTKENLTEEERYYMYNLAIQAHWTSRFKDHNGLVRV